MNHTDTNTDLRGTPVWGDYLATLPNGNTRSSFHYDLRMYRAFLDARGIPGPAEATPQDLAAFIASLLAPGRTVCGKPRPALKPRSVERVQTTLKRFYAYLQGVGLFPRKEEAPTFVFGQLRMRYQRINPKPLPPSERNALVSVATGSGEEDLRRGVATMFAFHCGLRVSEVAKLRKGDWSLTDFTVTVLGKGCKERIVPMTAALVRLLVRYLVWKSRQPGLRFNPWLFPSPMDEEKHIHPATLQNWLKRDAKAAGIGAWEKVSVHRLRHSFGTQLAETNANAFHIQALMGHYSVAISQHYVMLVDNLRLLREAHTRAFEPAATAETAS